MESGMNLSGEISPVSVRLEGVLSPVSTIAGALSASIPSIDFSLTVPADASTPIYDGAYEITPRPFEDVVLETDGRRMTEDIRVFEIPYYTTTNLQGGYTAIIGE